MDLLEIMPWGREEAEQEREFLSEAWLSTPMLEEDNDHSTEQDNDLDKSKNSSAHEQGPIKKEDSEMSIGNNESFLKWMEMNDMELAMYQQSSLRQDILKDYTEGCDWENSNSSVADTTQALLEEFQTICAGYHGALTPPQSRTPSPPPPLISYIPQTIQQLAPPPCQAPQSLPAVDLAQELALLDELVRDRAEALENAKPHLEPKCSTVTPEPLNLIEILVNYTPDVPLQVQIPAPPTFDEKGSQEMVIPDTNIPSVKVELISPSHSPSSLQEVPSSEGIPSPSSYLSPNSVTPSSPGSPRPNSPASSTCGEEASDPEWVPLRTTVRRQRSKPYSRAPKSITSGYSSSERSEMSPGPPSTSRGRRVPRNRGQVGPEDRRERKKEQNKNAATRYRQKKRAEAEEVASEVQVLEKKKEELRGKAADLAREVTYLKKLMKEMFKAKGML